MRPERGGKPTCEFRLERTGPAAQRAILAQNTPRSLPATRGDCVDGPRPCRYLTCRYNSFLEVTKAGSIQFNYPSPEEVPPGLSCALDLAEDGEHTREEVALILGMKRQALDDLENKAIRKLRRLPLLHQAWDEFVPIPEKTWP